MNHFTPSSLPLKSIVALSALCLTSSHAANLIINPGFEADGYTAGELNNQVVAVTGWSSSLTDNKLRYDTTSDNDEVPGSPNTVIRLTPSVSIYQNFSSSWDADDTFTVSFNASEVYWKSGAVGNGIWASLRSTTGAEYEAQLADLDGTHGGSETTYATWQENQTFSFDFSGADLIVAGATAGDDLRVNFFSKGDSDSINWIDNVSVVVPEPASASLIIGLGAVGLLLRRRRVVQR